MTEKCPSVTIFFENCQDGEKWRSDKENNFSELYKKLAVCEQYSKFWEKVDQ